MLNFKNLIYAITCLSFSIVIGAAVFEHMAVWPIAYAAPPASLSMFQGEYGMNPGLFWSKIHPATLLLFITTLILFWKTDSRKTILISFGGYILMMVATATYFVPELLDIVNTEYANTVDEGLKNRGSLWMNLSLLRLVIIIVLAINLFLGLTKIGVEKV